MQCSGAYNIVCVHLCELWWHQTLEAFLTMKMASERFATIDFFFLLCHSFRLSYCPTFPGLLCILHVNKFGGSHLADFGTLKLGLGMSVTWQERINCTFVLAYVWPMQKKTPEVRWWSLGNYTMFVASFRCEDEPTGKNELHIIFWETFRNSKKIVRKSYDIIQLIRSRHATTGSHFRWVFFFVCPLQNYNKCF